MGRKRRQGKSCRRERELVGSEKDSRMTTSEATFATSHYMSRRIDTRTSRKINFKPTKKLAIMFTSLSRTHSKFCWDATLSWPLLSLSLFGYQILFEKTLEKYNCVL